MVKKLMLHPMHLKMYGLLRRCAPRNDEKNSVIASGVKQSMHLGFSFIMSICFFTSVAFAAEFIASVDHKEGAVGESFILELKLADASAQSSPLISVLKNAFNITGQQQFSNMAIINGHMSSTVSWRYALVPKKEGKQTIPAISIESSAGTLTTQPISLSVGKASARSVPKQNKGITFSAKVSKPAPYKNEPITYTAKFVSHHDLANVDLGNLTVKNAIVEANGEPKIYDSTQNGAPVKVIETQYIITPLKAGTLTIPGMLVQGNIPVREKQRFDPFSLFRHFDSMNMFGVTHLEPFTVMSKAITLEVKAPVQGVVPWLPATSLKISENWDEMQTPKVGEPLTRGFTIVAEGVTPNALPSLKDQQLKDIDLKVYADKPMMEKDIKKGPLISWRQEDYTLVPQRSGTFILPEISVAWWDVKQNKIRYATVPERTLEVASSPMATEEPARAPEAPTETEATTQIPSAPEENNRVLYAIILSLILLLLFLIFWAVMLRRKVTGLAGKNNQKQTIDKSISHKDLAEVKSADALQRFLQSYGHQHWHTAKNASLEVLFAAAKKQYPTLRQETIDSLVTSLQDALYADKPIDLEDLKKHCLAIIQTTQKKVKKTRGKREKLPHLNPR